MPKTLLTVTNTNGAICSAELNCDSQTDYDRIGASILSLMDQDEVFALQILDATATYVFKRKALAAINKQSMRSAEIKTKN